MSKSKKNVLRGLHLQKKFGQDKFISVVKGKIFDVVVDLRKDSEFYGKHMSFEISAEETKQLYVSAGFAHGFCVLENNTEVMYKVDNFHSKENNRAIVWNDPTLSIKWPVSQNECIVSDKDESGSIFKDFVSPF